jgi:hypothetical protein
VNDATSWLTFRRPVSFHKLVDFLEEVDPEAAETISAELDDVGLMHASFFANREGDRPTAASLTVTRMPCPPGDGRQLAQSLARSESASGRPATVVEIPAGPVALSVADGVREATTNIGPFARYRAWLPLPSHGCTVLFDMTTPHVSGWETYGLLMAGILRTTRIGEQAE